MLFALSIISLYPYIRDGRLLAGGGRSRFLHLWTLDTRNLLRIIELPKKVTTVKQLEFLPDSFDAGANQVSFILNFCSAYLST